MPATRGHMVHDGGPRSRFDSGRAVGGEPPHKGEPPPHAPWKLWTLAILAPLGVLVVLYFGFAHIVQDVIFDGVMRKGWYIVPGALLLWGIIRFQSKYGFLGHRRGLIVYSTLSVIYVGWCMAVSSMTDLMTYKYFAANFTERKGLIASAPVAVRFTPLDNACKDIANSVSSTGETVDCAYVRPIVTENGFGYVAPLVPSGFLNVFWEKNKGFLFLDDSYRGSTGAGSRVTRIDDVQDIGPGMEWFDNLTYQLARVDFFANYDTPHYLALDDREPRKLTLVVPKIKYALLWRLPYWAGVVIVHSSGKIEDLSVEQALKDPRLKGKWIFPEELAKHYVKIQNYKAGYGVFTPYARLEGKLEIEHLPTKNQFPFVTKGADGKTYLVTATRGEGGAQGLFRMYYVDAHTGEGTYHQFDPHESVYGVSASAARLTNIPGYNWHRKSGDSATGNIIGAEPVYIVRPNDPDLYWKFTITNVDHSGISATAVSKASRPDDIRVFQRREDYEGWLQGGMPAAPPSSSEKTASTPARADLLRQIEHITRDLEKLRRDLEKLPQ